jgi:hypothetical protein
VKINRPWVDFMNIRYDSNVQEKNLKANFRPKILSKISFLKKFVDKIYETTLVKIIALKT